MTNVGRFLANVNVYVIARPSVCNVCAPY